jgi:hypothetical protein
VTATQPNGLQVQGSQGLTVSLESTTGRDDEDRAILRSLLGRLTFSG